MLDLSPYKIYSQRDFHYEIGKFNPSFLLEFTSNIKDKFEPYYDHGEEENKFTTQKAEVNRKCWDISHNILDEYPVFQKSLINCSKRANKKFNFNLESFLDLKYYEYYPTEENLNWHIDIGPLSYSHRKLSFSIMVSNEDEYQGGDLQIWLDNNYSQKVPKLAGGIVFFPSFLIHRVTPITEGLRKVIVGWLGGEPYK